MPNHRDITDPDIHEDDWTDTNSVMFVATADGVGGVNTEFLRPSGRFTQVHTTIDYLQPQRFVFFTHPRWETSRLQSVSVGSRGGSGFDGEDGTVTFYKNGTTELVTGIESGTGVMNAQGETTYFLSTRVSQDRFDFEGTAYEDWLPDDYIVALYDPGNLTLNDPFVQFTIVVTFTQIGGD